MSKQERDWDLWCMDGCGIVAHEITMAEAPSLSDGHLGSHPDHRHFETRSHTPNPVPDLIQSEEA